jgi:MoaA/NifB/PqqE/SkfB family radical SAM enzyme
MTQKPKYEDIKRVFCSYPWSELATKNTGELVVCREQQEDHSMGYLGTGDQYNIGKSADPQIVLNSELHKDIRRAQLRGEWHSNCTNCRLVTDNPIKGIQRRVPEDREIAELIRSADEDGYIADVKVQTLDLRFGNLCNHACLHCTPADSTMWYEDYYGFFGDTFHKGPGKDYSTTWTLTRVGNDKLVSNVEPFIKSEHFWNVLDRIKDGIVDINVLGGEPFIMQDHDKVLDYFIEHDLAKNILLHYNSNLSVVNPKLLERWKHFRRIRLAGSMDEIGDRFAVVRYGGVHDRFVENMKRLCAVPNIEFWGLSVCYMLPNMLSMERIESWAAETCPPPVTYRWIYNPHYMSVDSLPVAARRELIEFNRAVGTEKSIALANFMQARLSVPEDPEAIRTFVKLMDYLDHVRRQDWRNTMPDVYDFLKRHCGVV